MAQGRIRALNQKHNNTLNSDEFKYHKTRAERDEITRVHRIRIEGEKSLILMLLSLNADMIDPEINADIDDFLVRNNAGKRLSRRLRRAYYNAMARECLNSIDVDPLRTFGSDSKTILKGMKSVP